MVETGLAPSRTAEQLRFAWACEGHDFNRAVKQHHCRRSPRHPTHIPNTIPASTAPVSFFRSVIGTNRVCCSLTSITPTGTARTPPPPPPPSPRALVSPTPPVPAPSP